MNTIQDFRLSTPRTARFFRWGEPSGSTTDIWVLFHGYGQSAFHFLKKFGSLAGPETVLYAPEGLSRFYLKGFDGRVGASWMTREERLDEIADQVTYIDRLLEEINPAPGIRINLLGFSQGAAVASRWQQQSRLAIHHFVLWGAGLPIEFTADMEQKLSICNTLFMLGDADEFLSSEVLREHFSRLDLMNFRHRRLQYQGGHEITQEALEMMKKELNTFQI
jgi:predicted esterase